MGATDSLPSVTDVTIPVNYAHISDDDDYNDYYSFQEPIKIPQIYQPPFHATWSVEFPLSRKVPLARSGHFTVFDEEGQKVYIGYGTSFKNEILSDFWEFDLETLMWREIKINNPIPMNGCRGFLDKEKIYIFGGFINGKYSNLIQVVNIKNFEISILETSGDVPEPRSTPILAVYEDKLYVWGGYNGQWPTDISILDLKTLVWSAVHQNEKGRTSVPYIFDKDNGKIISYGGSHLNGLFTIDLKSEKSTTKIVPTNGSVPPPDTMHSSMVKIDNLIIYFGGKSKDSNCTVLYAYDMIRNYWFVFHVLPDNETVTLKDGIISENGLFMLPSMHSFSASYSKKHRTIVAFLGSPCVDPPQLYLLKLGKPLAHINMKNDMLDMLKM